MAAISASGCLPLLCFRAAVPNLFGARDRFQEDNFSADWGGEDGFRRIQMHHIQAHLLLCSPVPNRPGPVPGWAWRLETPAVECILL